MLPENELFTRRQTQMQEQSGKLLRSAEMRKNINGITSLLRDYGESVSAPGLGQIRAAVQKELDAESVAFPRGKVYASINYDQVRMSNPDIETPDNTALDAPGIEYVSRIYAVTTEQEQGKIMKKLDEWMDGPQKISSKALIMTVTPKEAGNIFDIDSVIFVVVQATGGENFCYQLVPNDHKNKVIAQEAMENEYGDIREKFGYIDKCELKAVPATPTESVNIAAELERVNTFLEKNKPQVETKKEKVKRQIGSLGTSISTKIKAQPFINSK